MHHQHETTEMDWQAPPLSLYIHIPWCVRKCPYCDFNSHQAAAEIPENEYVGALLRDLEADIELFESRFFNSIFVGGGTPSLFSAESIDRLLSGVNNLCSISENPEITLEANPGAVDSARFREFRSAGINRISIGVQSFDGQLLEALGRVHDGRQARAAIELAARAGFENMNVDLMFGLPGQSRENAACDLQSAIDFHPAQISFYELTLEPNTYFYTNPPKLPDDDTIWAIQQKGKSLLEKAGYEQYEISAFARPGFQCGHNLNYWNYGDYFGIGAGAHGKVTEQHSGGIRRYWKVKHPTKYMAAAGHPENIQGKSVVDSKQIPFEFAMNALRLSAGFDLSVYLARTGLSVSTLEPALSTCIAEGLLEKSASRVKCTARGFRFLNSLLQHFLAD